MPVARVVITKERPFRDRTERWSNGYRFNLPTIDEATIGALAAALITMERGLHDGQTTFQYANGGRDAPGAQSVYVEEFATPLAGTLSAPEYIHPENVLLFQAKRRQRVYARKMYHSCTADVQGSRLDLLDPAWRAAQNAKLAPLTDGSLPGGARYVWPDGTNVATPFTLDPFVRVRQFDRRGKRPTQAAPQTP